MSAALPLDDSSAAGEAWLALRLLAVDPALLGGLCLRSAAGPVRDRWLADLRGALAPAAPWRQVPSHVDVDRLLGGLDLAATLQRGSSVAQRGLLVEADGGVVVLAMAERADEAHVAHVNAALDTGEVLLARHGIVQRDAARFAVVALDEGVDDDERPAESLLDRLALRVGLEGVSVRAAEQARADAAITDSSLADARAALPAVRLPDDVLEALCAAAVALGVDSIRACVLAARAARVAAALAGRVVATADDAAVAARLVLAPRATRMPAKASDADEESEDAQEEHPEPPPDADRGDDAVDSDTSEDSRDADADDSRTDEMPAELVLAAAAAAIPRGLLARLAMGEPSTRRRTRSGRAGATQQGQRHGRPAGARRTPPRGGDRLDLIATLRAAAPWQRLRNRDAITPSNAASSATGDFAPRVRIRTDDFHVARRIQRGRTTTIFAVDASGSSALQRLAEAKGAVELLLAECYVRRDSVAVIAFRGRGSELLLPPTRSLVRAKRSLASLPGGGGTPLAAGIDAALLLALGVRRKGDTPVIVVLTDGRANVARDGSGGRAGADADALLAARAMRAAQLSTLLIDTSPQPQARARELAAAMQARYLPLPYAGAAVLSEAVRVAATSESSRGR